MGRMSDPDFAYQFRDVIRSLVKAEIDARVPKAVYGSVQGFDRVNYTASVLFQGDSGPTNVRMGSIQPIAIGQIVRVEGSGSDRYITDVVGGGYSTGASQIITDWNNATESGNYIGIANATANSPLTSGTFAGTVAKSYDGVGALTQTLTRISGVNILSTWVRQYSGSSWSAWRRLYDDTGPVSASSVMNAVAGQSVTAGTFRRIGQLCQMNIQITTPAITVAANGSITNTTVGTITDSRFIPSSTSPFITGSVGPPVMGAVTPAGVLSLYTFMPGQASLSSGTTLTLNASYQITADTL